MMTVELYNIKDDSLKCLKVATFLDRFQQYMPVC